MTLKQFQFVDREQSDALMEQATCEERRRAHLLLHENHSDSVQRLLVALAEGTYIQPHSHPEQWEMVVPLRGVITLLVFTPEGVVLRRQKLRADGCEIVQIPAGLLHTLLAATPTALILEVKPGPFRTALFANWAPEESDRRAQDFVTQLASVQPGISLSSQDKISRGHLVR